MADDPRVIVPVANHLFSLDTLHEADRLATNAPERVTDEHLAHLAHYVTPRQLANTIRRRDEAVQRRAEEAFEAAQAHAAEQRRAALAPPPIEAASLEGLSLKEICARYPDEPATLGLVGDVVAFAQDMNERNKERNAKIAALEARVLELEAQKAVADGKR